MNVSGLPLSIRLVVVVTVAFVLEVLRMALG